MKLEYKYSNNYNVNNIIKLIVIYCIFLVLDIFDGRMDTIHITYIPTCFLLIIFTLISNNYMRKQFNNIKDNGAYFQGVITMAGTYRDSRSMERLGYIEVFANNKMYKISQIAYNHNFNRFKQKVNSKNNMNREQIRVDIYVLDNKVVADFDSITGIE